jgi:ABC1 atypical kinase-like domain
MRFLAVALTVVAIVASVVAIVGGFAVLSRRLLGLRFGLVRLLLAGLIGFGVAGPIAQAVSGSLRAGDRSLAPLWFLLLTGACALLVAMVFLVVAEALVPSGSLPGPLEWRRALRGWIARARRYSQISRIAIRHGLAPYLRGRRRAELDAPDGRARLARSVRCALEEGGVTFVKLGQVLSTRPDLLPVEFVEELGQLRDQVAPAPWAEVEQVLAAELGGPVDEVFAEVDHKPLAAPRSPRCTPPGCGRAPRWWSRCSGPGSARWRRLPRRVERITSAAEHGRLSVHVRLFADERDRRHVTGLLHQVLLTILAATAGIMAVLLLGTAGGPRMTTTVSLYQFLGYNLLVVCAILALRVLVLIFRPDR